MFTLARFHYGCMFFSVARQRLQRRDDDDDDDGDDDERRPNHMLMEGLLGGRGFTSILIWSGRNLVYMICATGKLNTLDANA